MRKREGFSLIELLIVIAIIAIVASMIMPALQTAGKKAKYARWLGYKNSLRCDDGLIAYYDFEEGEGAILKNKAIGPPEDTSYDPEKLNGTINGPTWTFGRWAGKGALDFDGNNDYVAVPNSSSLKPDLITICAWIFPYKKSDYMEIVSKFYSDGYYIRIMHPTWYGFRVDFYAAWTSNATDTELTEAKWHYVAAAFDGTYQKVYINGKLKHEASGGVSPGPPKIKHVDNRLTIGSFTSGESKNFQGKIDEVAIYKRALTAKEIRNHYEMGRP